MAITEHAEKFAAFEIPCDLFYPKLHLLKPIEDHDVEAEAYNKCRKLFEKNPDLSGVYVSTEASIPVLNAARDAKLLDRLTIITTDLFPDLVSQIRSGAVAATIYQRPRAQGQIAFRMLHEFLVEGASRSHQVALAPHLVMRGNLDFFLQRQISGIGQRKRRAGPGSNARTGGRLRVAQAGPVRALTGKPRGGNIAYLGIDVGTGGTRALVMDAAGQGHRLRIGRPRAVRQPAARLGRAGSARLVARLRIGGPQGAAVLQSERERNCVRRILGTDARRGPARLRR